MAVAASRRRWLGWAAALPLAGCGFELRRAPDLPFERIALQGFVPRSPLLEELSQTLRQSARIVELPGQPDAVLVAITDRREKSVVASTAAGQVRTLTLRVRFEFRLTTAGGRELIPPTPLVLARDMSYNETFALAKEQEESQLYAAMQSDVVLQVMRRLAQVKKT